MPPARFHVSRLPLQRGNGFLGSIFRAITPAFKTGLRSAANIGRRAIKNQTIRNLGKEALKSAVDVTVNLAADALEGDLSKDKLAKNISSARKRVADAVRDGNKKQRISPQKSVKQKKVKAKRWRRPRDIFD